MRSAKDVHRPLAVRAPADRKEAARAGLVAMAGATDVGSHTQLWARVNALDSPRALDDLTPLVTEIGDRVDVVMVPQVQSPVIVEAERLSRTDAAPAERYADSSGRADSRVASTTARQEG